jgi:hypothetical protein
MLRGDSLFIGIVITCIVGRAIEASRFSGISMVLSPITLHLHMKMSDSMADIQTLAPMEQPSPRKMRRGTKGRHSRAMTHPACAAM